MMSFSIIIPVYNEVKAIEETLTKIHKTLQGFNFKYEIIVVNDGSTDRTTEKLEELKKKINFINISRWPNKGYGSAIKLGIINAVSENILITDADGTYPIEDIPKFFTEFKSCDMLVGVRSFKNLPNKTKPVKWMLGKLANYVTETEIPDINSGFRIFKKNSFIPFLPIIPDGFSLTTTITLGMIISNYNVKYIPIKYHVRKGKSKIKPIYDTLNFIKIILKIGLFLSPMKIFTPLSLFLFIGGIFWGAYSWIFLGNFADTSTLVLIIGALQLFILSLISELINKRTQNFFQKIK